MTQRRQSDELHVDDLKTISKVHMERLEKLPTIESNTSSLPLKPIPSIKLTEVEENDQSEESDTFRPQKDMKSLVQTKMQVGSKFGKCKS
jgi:hypothetical protein